MAASAPAFGFGALAIDHVQGPRYGFSYNQGSADAARAAALRKCGGDCRVAVEFRNTCAAFAGDQASGSTRYAWAHRPDGKSAQAAAVRICREAGGRQCAIRVWACEGRIHTDRRAWAKDVLVTRTAAAPTLFPSGDNAAQPRKAELFPHTKQSTLLTALEAEPSDATSAPNANPLFVPEKRPALPKLTLLQRPDETTKASPSVASKPVAEPLNIPATVDGGRRVALVIGNDAYTAVDPLRKTVNDARSVGAALARLGFEVICVESGSRREMNRKIVEFTRTVGRGDTAFFFFAGHGVEIRGVNYLLPVDVPVARDGDEALIVGEGIPAETVIEQLQQRGAKISLLVLDACRDNPFKRLGSRGIGASRGLAQMTAPEGVFVLYSAGVGQTALDRLSDRDANPNSIFTRTFLRMLGETSLTVQQIAKRTQFEVRKLAASVNHAQMPAYYDQILGQFTLATR